MQRDGLRWGRVGGIQGRNQSLRPGVTRVTWGEGATSENVELRLGWYASEVWSLLPGSMSG